MVQCHGDLHEYPNFVCVMAAFLRNRYNIIHPLGTCYASLPQSHDVVISHWACAIN